MFIAVIFRFTFSLFAEDIPRNNLAEILAMRDEKKQEVDFFRFLMHKA